MGLIVSSVSAQAGYGWHSDDVSVDIVSDYGHEFEQYPVDGTRKTKRAYVSAEKGKNYNIRIINHSNKRVGLVIAVDGRNIISGRKSHLQSNERMYVLDPYQTAEYEGWRTGKHRVNRFYFTDANHSYADAWKDHSAMGVIAVAVFQPKKNQAYYKNKPSSTSKHSAREAGTGFGEAEYSPTRSVKFRPKSRPSEKHFLRYEWRNVLCDKGIADCGYRSDTNRFWKEYWYDEDYAPYPPIRRGHY